MTLQPHGLDSPWNSPGQNTRVSNRSLLQGIFTTQGSDWGLLHCRWILYQLRYQRSPDKDITSCKVKATQSCPTLCDPIDSATPSTIQSMEFSRPEYRSGAVQFSSVTQLCQTLCNPMDCSMPGLPVRPPITNSWSLRRLKSIESVMPSNHRSLCCPLLLPPSIPPSIRVFSNESVLRIRWPKYWRDSR